MTDGRNDRRVKNRALMIETGRQFIAEGNWRPSGRDITHRAGMSIRTFFFHFGSMDGFWEAVLEAHYDFIQDCKSRIILGDLPYVILIGREPVRANDAAGKAEPKGTGPA